MDLKQIKQIIDLMKRSDLTEFAVEEEGFKLRIRRGPAGQPVVSTSGATTPPFGASSVDNPATADNGDQSTEDAGFTFVTSPMVGTFYRSPAPESPPFTDVGQKISESSVVCIIEAMKVMNEIQAETKGTIVDVLVENGQPVEFGQKLFKVRAG